MIVGAVLVALTASGRVKADTSTESPIPDNHYPYIIREVSASASHFVTEQPVTSSYTDPKLVLLENNIPLYLADKLGENPDASYEIGGIITIERAPLIHIIDGKRSKDVHSWTTTVNDLLLEQKVMEIGQQDKVDPVLVSPVVDGMTITIIRVQETDVIEKETIPFNMIDKNDDTMYRGETKVQTAGHTGVKQYTYHVHREDGDEKWRKLTKTEITTTKEDRIILHGTKLRIKQTISGRATWYSSRYAAASHLWPRGTHIRVTNPANGKSLETTIDDYMESDQSVVDLNLSLFKQLADPYGDMPKLNVDWVLN